MTPEEHLNNILKILNNDNYDEVTTHLIRVYCMAAELIKSEHLADISDLYEIEQLTGVKFYE